MITLPDTLRAARFNAILQNYYGDDSLADNAVDLLLDALHWSLLNGQGFKGLLSKAQAIAGAEPRRYGRLSPIGERLFNLAGEIENFIREQDGQINPEAFDELCKYETKLLAYGNLLEWSNSGQFLNEEISEAAQYLARVKQSDDGKLTG